MDDNENKNGKGMQVKQLSHKQLNDAADKITEAMTASMREIISSLPDKRMLQEDYQKIIIIALSYIVYKPVMTMDISFYDRLQRLMGAYKLLLAEASVVYSSFLHSLYATESSKNPIASAEDLVKDIEGKKDGNKTIN